MQKFKKSLAFILILMICITALPLTALTVSAETVKIGYISKENVNIRKDATTSSEKVGNVSKWTVNVTKSKKDTQKTINPKTNKTYIWYKISYTSLSKTITGYIREDLIEVKEYELDPNFKKTLKDFPKSYRDDLTVLHALYPNWEFKADKVDGSFKDSVTAQDTEFRKLVTTSYNSLRSMRKGCYDWSEKKFITSDNNKYGASREVIAYYMDPRNFLNANDIYVFMQQSFDSETQTKDGVKKIIEGTFLDAKITNKKDDNYGKTYATVIMKAAKKSKVNPYVLASTIIQEQGRNGTSLGKGIEYKNKTVYNFFNFGASGSNKDEIYKNGAKTAYEYGWTTPSKALIEGAVKYGSGYIAVGQDTYFYKNYNVLNPAKIWHQYAQSVHDSLSSSRILKTNYSDFKDLKVTFRIPVYEDMPEEVSEYPEENDKLNNYYFSSIKVSGLTPKYNRYINDYSLEVDGNTTIEIETPATAKYTGKKSYELKKGKNKIKLKIQSETGYSRTYTINVTSKKSATLTIKQAGGSLVKKDDVYYLYQNGEVSDVTTLFKYKDKLRYIKNGVWDKSTTLVEYNDKLYYVKDGTHTKDTTTVQYENKIYYVEKGLACDKTGFITIDGATYYFEKGILATEPTLTEQDGKLLYIENGVHTIKETLIKYNGKLYYVKDGYHKKSTKFFKYDKKYYYIEKGICSDKTTLISYNDQLRYIENGVWTKTETIVKYNDKTYYVKDGIHSTDTLMLQLDGKTYYIKKGILSTKTGLVKFNKKYYNLKDGVLSTKTTLVKYKDKYYYVKNGIHQIKTTFVKYKGKYRYVKDGFYKKSTKFVEYKGKKYYVKKGVRSTATTLVKYKGKYYYIKDGVHLKKTTLVKYKGKYRYVKDGFYKKSTTFVKYKGKYYYVKKGIRSTDTKFVKYKGKYYYIKKGVRSSSTTLVKYNNKYYYIKKGVRTKATTLVKYKKKYYYVKDGVWKKSTKIVKYKNKKYYIKNGVSQPKFSGKVKINGKTYKIKKGIVV